MNAQPEGRRDRRQQILEVLAHELEANPGTPITTAGLAHAVGVSEAALYRHFASKAQMFEALIGFAEDTVFGLVNRILADEPDVVNRCQKMLGLLLGFSERNPGITRVLIGDALVGENERLRTRVGQFFDRLETQFRQVLREATLCEGLRPAASAPAAASLLLAVAEGRMSRFVRSGFKATPTSHWQEQWDALARGVFEQRPHWGSAANTR